MTREEAKAYFKRHIDLYCVTGICREAEEMAIQALEQINKITALLDGTIDHFDRDDAIDLLYEIKGVIK